MSMSAALSGLNAAESALQTISNNLANMNTDGYKVSKAGRRLPTCSIRLTATAEVAIQSNPVLACK